MIETLFYFKNESDILDSLIQNKNEKILSYIWQSCLMAAKNSSLSKMKENASKEYFNIILKRYNYDAKDFYFLKTFEEDYETILGKMLHNYTYLRDGIKLNILSKDNVDIYIINEYTKIGSNVTIRRKTFIKEGDRIERFS